MRFSKKLAADEEHVKSVVSFVVCVRLLCQWLGCDSGAREVGFVGTAEYLLFCECKNSPAVTEHSDLCLLRNLVL